MSIMHTMRLGGLIDLRQIKYIIWRGSDHHGPVEGRRGEEHPGGSLCDQLPGDLDRPGTVGWCDGLVGGETRDRAVAGPWPCPRAESTGAGEVSSAAKGRGRPASASSISRAA